MVEHEWWLAHESDCRGRVTGLTAEQVSAVAAYVWALGHR
jgi:hypothetical protein